MIREHIYESTFCSDLRYSVYIDTAQRPGRLETGIMYHTIDHLKKVKCNVTETASLEIALDQFFRLCDKMVAMELTLVKTYN